MGDGLTFKQLTRSGFPIKFYGFLRMDAYYTTARMDNIIIPFFVRNESNGEAENNDDAFAFDARLTRFGFDIDGGIALQDRHHRQARDGLRELRRRESSESRETPRMRLAYVNLKNDKYVSADRPGLGRHFSALPRDQRRIADVERGQPRRSPAAGPVRLDDAADPKCAALRLQDLRGHDWRDQQPGPGPDGRRHLERARRDRLGPPQSPGPARPDGQVVGLRADVVLGSVGRGRPRTRPTPMFNGEDEFDTWLVGVDFQVPIINHLKLRGEAWAGHGAQRLPRRHHAVDQHGDRRRNRCGRRMGRARSRDHQEVHGRHRRDCRRSG